MNKIVKIIAISVILILLTIIILANGIFKTNTAPLTEQIANKNIVSESDFSQMGESYSDKIYEKYDSIMFGSQKSGFWGLQNTPIEWIVLAKENNKALIMTKYVIDCKAFDYVDIENLGGIDDAIKENYKYVTWETCSLRRWLNDEFVKNSFSKEEINNIIDTKLEDTKTIDKVFCLGEEEYIKYFDNGNYYERNRNIGDSHIYYNGATIRNKNALKTDKYKMIDANRTYDYWLRDKDINEKKYGIEFGTSKTVGIYGDINYSVNYDIYCGVRPVMWVSY